MDAKISGDFWEDELVGELPPEVKLCALWLMTNSRRKLSGYVELSDRVFKFHTGLESEVLPRTIEALGKSFIKVGKGIWIRNFIKRQFGTGEKLANNNCTKSLCKELELLRIDELTRMVADEYPEIRHLLFPSDSSKTNKPLATPYQGGRVEKSRVEKREEGVGETEPAPKQGEFLSPESAQIAPQTSAPAVSDFGKKSPAATTQKKGAAESVPMADQVRRFGAIFGRKPGGRWSYAEETALSAAQPVHESELRLIEYRYRQPEEEKDPRRQRLHTLLENLPGEIDAARAQLKRHSSDITTCGAARQEPKGWLDILEKKYRRPEDTEWTAPKSFYELPDSVRAEILKEIEQQKTCEK